MEKEQIEIEEKKKRILGWIITAIIMVAVPTIIFLLFEDELRLIKIEILERKIEALKSRLN